MYDFIKIQHEHGKLTAEQVRGFVPRWITEGQADEIIGGDTDDSAEDGEI